MSAPGARALAAPLVLLVAVLCGGPSLATPDPPQVIGEHLYGVVLETPHPYPSPASTQAELVWSDRYSHPGARYLVFEFRKSDLAPGDRVEVRDTGRRQVHVYRGRGSGTRGATSSPR